MALRDRLAAVRSFDPSRFAEFVVDGQTLGYVRSDLVEHLRRFPAVFELDARRVGLRATLNDPRSRSAAMADVAHTLAAQGVLSRWRDETYDIAAPQSGAVSFVLERAAVRFFGFTARAIHVNGLTGGDPATHMWIARRAHDKPIDPGMLDNMVGGGLASGLTIAQTVVKEAWEEAGIPAHLAERAQARGSLQILREVPEGLHAETIYTFDLTLPDAFEPSNQDGEVAEHRLMAMAEVRDALEGDAPFTADAALVALDCLARRGWTPPL